MRGILRVLSYEGLPPEVGAFNFHFWPHAPWPVHNFEHFGHFYGYFGSRGVGVIPGIVEGIGWRRPRGLNEERAGVKVGG